MWSNLWIQYFINITKRTEVIHSQSKIPFNVRHFKNVKSLKKYARKLSFQTGYTFTKMPWTNVLTKTNKRKRQGVTLWWFPNCCLNNQCMKGRNILKRSRMCVKHELYEVSYFLPFFRTGSTTVPHPRSGSLASSSRKPSWRACSRTTPESTRSPSICSDLTLMCSMIRSTRRRQRMVSKKLISLE